MLPINDQENVAECSRSLRSKEKSATDPIGTVSRNDPDLSYRSNTAKERSRKRKKKASIRTAIFSRNIDPYKKNRQMISMGYIYIHTFLA